MKLLDNPFYILKCLPESPEKTILEQAKIKRTEIGEQLCNNSMNILLDTSKRLEAEVSWFPGFNMDLLTKRICVIYKFFQKYVSNFIFIKTNNYLSEANLLAFGLENEKTANAWNNDEIRLLISYICKNSEKINYLDTKKLIESSRAKGNFPLDISDDQLLYYIDEQKKYYRQVLFNFIIQLDSDRINEILTDIIKDPANNGESNCKWLLFQQIIDDYETQNSEFYQEQKNKINRIVDRMINSYELLDSSSSEVDNELIEILSLLVKVTEPIKALKINNGQNYEYFESIFNSIRDLYLKAINEYSNYTFSYKLIKLCQLYFNDISNLSELIENDRRALDELIYREQHKDDLFYEWGNNPKKSIKADESYITINNKNQYSFNQIIKYKISKPDSNGFTLSFIVKHGKGPIQIKIPNKDFYEKLKDLFLKKVAIPLTFDYADILREGNEIRLGKLAINDDGVELSGKSFFMNNTKMFSWNQIKNINFDDYSINIIGPGSFKVSESLDVDYNMEVIKLMLIVFKSKGLSGRLSDNL